MSARTRAALVAVLTGFLLWLGLSPRLARYVYQWGLMPRCRTHQSDEDAEGRMQVSPVTFTSKNVTLHGAVCTPCEYVSTPEKNRNIVLYFGGRRSNRTKNSIRVNALMKTGTPVFAFTYRGFGEERGHASVRSLLEDGLAAYDAVIHLGFKPEQIILYGESLGAAVAAYVSSKRSVRGIILQSGFSSLEVQMKDMIPILRVYPRCLFPKHDLSMADSIQPDHPPLLILHGDQDSVVHKKHADWIAKTAGNGTTLTILSGANHLNVHSRDDWLAAVSEFLTSLEGSAKQALH